MPFKQCTGCKSCQNDTVWSTDNSCVTNSDPPKQLLLKSCGTWAGVELLFRLRPKHSTVILELPVLPAVHPSHGKTFLSKCFFWTLLLISVCHWSSHNILCLNCKAFECNGSRIRKYTLEVPLRRSSSMTLDTVQWTHALVTLNTSNVLHWTHTLDTSTGQWTLDTH